MLSLEYLLEEAKNNGLPLLKKRAILREYLLVIILNSIYKHKLGKSMFFTGGTALRFFYNLPRFSEDLDFDTPDLSFDGFKDILTAVELGLKKEGFSPEISFKQRDNLFVAEAHFKALMGQYKIIDERSVDLMAKIEVLMPGWRLKSEQGVLDLYNYSLSAVLLGRENVISEKLCALLNRKRGRDIYDILFMLKRKYQFDEDVLAANKITGRPKELILDYLGGLKEKELISLANQVKPFLFKEDDADLVLKSYLYAEKYLKEY